MASDYLNWATRAADVAVTATGHQVVGELDQATTYFAEAQVWATLAQAAATAELAHTNHKVYEELSTIRRILNRSHRG